MRRRHTSRSAELLHEIADRLGVPVEHFLKMREHAERAGSVDEGDALRAEQEDRLLMAFRRVTDEQARQRLIGLAEALATEPLQT